jgi:TPR repeat protein
MSDKIRFRWEIVQKPVARPARRRTSPWRLSAGSILCLAALIVFGFGYWCWDCATLKSRASRGDAAAQYRFGKQSFEWAKTSLEYSQSVEWIRLAADQGNAKAETALGQLYLRGLVLPCDYSEANKWLRRAAEQGAAVAENELGIIYAKGMGVPQDFDQAIAWCAKAAARGSTVAKRNLDLVEVMKRKLIGDITTSDGRLHKGVTLQSVAADGITVKLEPQPGSMVLAKLKVENLTGRLKELCRHTGNGSTNSPFSQMDSLTARL